MKSLIRAESKRVLNRNIFILIIVIIILFSVISGLMGLNSYKVISGNKILYTAKENLRRSKKESKYTFLDKEFISSLKDKKIDNIQFYKNIDKILVKNYDLISYSELTESRAKDFYNKRLINIKKNLEGDGEKDYSKKDIKYLLQKANKIKKPIQMDYAEGWKNINRDLGMLVLLLIIISSIVILQIFGKIDKFNMDELSRTTRKGKMELSIAKVIVAIKISLIIYFTGILILLIVNGIIYGFEGFSMSIQSNPTYLYSIFKINYLQQFLINVSLGLVALLFMVGFVLFVTAVTKNLLIGGVITVFFWALMFVFEMLKDYEINHYFANFLPIKMTDFTMHYNANDIYKIFDNRYNSIIWTIMVTILISLILFILSYLIYVFRQNKERT
ncbi:MAG: hypothetical protein WAO56_08735 [Miniphocaeibacter sp.]|uniref:hypothetical protein n=1 Tax=Miniphocaeibacter sp. TaxID=3100973 RepID=UPI00184A3E04|nr:hypothetical protein [Gallicola sp.]